jgi:Lipase (class 3)
MVINSVPIDDMNTIVFAIRGTQSFRDWTVNLKTEPTSPSGFLDDSGNLCHDGFLSVARKMVQPVAIRLRELLDENPNRTSCSLVITGHSSGGAVASLLYCHMLSQVVQSELTHLRRFFKRVHCVTFGAPPVSLLPLQKPNLSKYRKSMFLSFINEGDPVCRAEKAYVRSLLELYMAPAPGSPVTHPTSVLPKPFSATTLNLLDVGHKEAQKPTAPQKTWTVPVSTLSNPGRLVILRTPRKRAESNQSPQEVEACGVTDADLREVIFGDPLMHLMDLYTHRIEVLATNAVTAKFSLW